MPICAYLGLSGPTGAHLKYPPSRFSILDPNMKILDKCFQWEAARPPGLDIGLLSTLGLDTWLSYSAVRVVRPLTAELRVRSQRLVLEHGRLPLTYCC